jgi:hypothetical protein
MWWWIAGLIALNAAWALATYFKPLPPRRISDAEIRMAMRVWPRGWMGRK